MGTYGSSYTFRPPNQWQPPEDEQDAPVSTVSGRNRADAFREVASENPVEWAGLDYAEQMKRANTRMASPKAKATRFLDLNKTEAGDDLGTRFGAQGREGMAIMAKHEPEAYAEVQSLAATPQVPMRAKINGQEYVGTPRRSVSEQAIQRTRAEHFKKKFEERVLKDREGSRAHELAMAKAPSQGRIDEATAQAALDAKNPHKMAQTNTAIAESTLRQDMLRQQLKERQANLPPQHAKAVEQFMQQAATLAASGNTKAAQAAQAQALRLMGVPVDKETLDAMFTPDPLAQQARSSDIMAKSIGQLDALAKSVIGVWDRNFDNADRQMVKQRAAAIVQKAVAQGVPQQEAEQEVLAALAQHGIYDLNP